MPQVTPSIFIDDSELVFAFVRASGPGGQNVNKVASAAELRFDARGSKNLSADVAVRLMRLAGQKLTKEGVIVIQADRFRSQEMNREDAIARLFDLIRKAATPPKKRIATKPTRASKEKRLDGKSKRAGVKKTRGAKPQWD